MKVRNQLYNKYDNPRKGSTKFRIFYRLAQARKYLTAFEIYLLTGLPPHSVQSQLTRYSHYHYIKRKNIKHRFTNDYWVYALASAGRRWLAKPQGLDRDFIIRKMNEFFAVVKQLRYSPFATQKEKVKVVEEFLRQQGAV